MASLTARDVADYLLYHVDEDAGDSMSNLKLQKLLYYAQGVHLALTGKPLFLEHIEAWQHGPAVPALYRACKGRGSCPLPRPKKLDLRKYDEQTRFVLDEVQCVFGQYTAS